MNDIVLEQEQIRDYLAGRLSDGQLREFEGRVAKDPALLRSMEEMLRFREGLEVLLERGELAPAVAERPRWKRWGMPLAAAAAIGAVGLFLGVSLLSRAPLLGAAVADLRLAASAPHVPVATYSLVALRQAGAGGALELPAAGPIQLRVLAPDGGPVAYRVVVTRQEGSVRREVGAISGIRREPDGFVIVYADAAGLTPGDYTIAAGPVGGALGGAIPFRLRVAEPAGTR